MIGKKRKRTTASSFFYSFYSMKGIANYSCSFKSPSLIQPILHRIWQKT